MQSGTTQHKLIPWFFITIFLIGAVLVGTYYILSFFGIGGIGQSSDIGGGILALFGYLLAGIGLIGGVVSVVIKFVQKKSR